MILENTKIKKYLNEPTDILRIFLALVFLAAGVFRVFNPSVARLEFINLQLPIIISWPVVIFELFVGIGLLLNKYVKYIYYLLIVFLVFILVWALMLNGQVIIRAAGELFVFNLNPTDVFLHFVFLLFVIVMIKSKK